MCCMCLCELQTNLLCSGGDAEVAGTSSEAREVAPLPNPHVQPAPADRAIPHVQPAPTAG